MSITPDRLMAVGAIVKAIGVRGEVIVKPMTDFPARLRRARTLWVGVDTHAAREMCVERVAVAPRGIRLKLGGIGDRTAAGALRGSLLFIDEAGAAPLKKGEFFVHDILGLTVRDEAGHELGTVADVLRYPASDVYVVRGAAGEIMLPAVREFVLGVDIAARTMTVRLIEGMVERS
ncbi:MAG TPA: ribosome maturation factor RimM [Bacteroidota bacterium]|nr:ribosome maturation factor RimM [Bacteroidota bacterium]